MKKLTAKDLLKEVKKLKKLAGSIPEWLDILWAYSAYGRGFDSEEGRDSADYMTDQSKYVAKYFKQVLEQNGYSTKDIFNSPLDDGNDTDIKKVWGGQMDEFGDAAWGFTSNDDRPFVLFNYTDDNGKLHEFFKHGPNYKEGIAVKEIRKAKAWLLGAIADLDGELSNKKQAYIVESWWTIPALQKKFVERLEENLNFRKHSWSRGSMPIFQGVFAGGDFINVDFDNESVGINSDRDIPFKVTGEPEIDMESAADAIELLFDY